MVALSVCTNAAAVQGGISIVFVDEAADGAYNGTSWTDAFTDLQTALSQLDGETQVWVAEGTYRPGTLRTSTFQLIDDVAIYGGLAGTEDPRTFDLDDRDHTANETVLDGEIGTSNVTDNSFHVVTGSGTSASSVLDGFTITGGYADGLSGMTQDVGGGILIMDGNPTIKSCAFVGNQAGTGGGAVHVDGGTPIFLNCRFLGNRSMTSQGANNFGGALYSVGRAGYVAAPLLLNCAFIGNRAGVGGGGSGGAICGGTFSDTVLVNSTLTANRADDDGGGLFLGGGSVTVTNCIFWGNRDRGGTDAPAQIFGAAVVSYSCIQGGWMGTGNIEDDPRFRDPVGADGTSGTTDDDLRLSPGSPCIDAGDNETPISGVAHDLIGDARFVNDPNTADTGYPPTATAIVDIGAYEFQRPCGSDADCNDHDLCTNEHCDAATGQCAYDHLECSDGVFCNGMEVCTGGTCEPGEPPDCDDGLDCTLDTCDSAADSCLNEPHDTPCDDGLFCNGVETCDAATGCSEGVNPCTEPLVCDEERDACVGCVLDGDCDDGDPCTTNACAAGACEHEIIPDCCQTDDDCESTTCFDVACTSGICVGTPVVDNTPCPDGLFCNGPETCQAGVCSPGASPCDAGEHCNEESDACVPQTQCQTDQECHDEDPCTDGTCDSGICEYVVNTAPCNDGDECTENDTCSLGVCVGTPIPGCDGPPPDDSDGDGLLDTSDRCPGTPPGESVDEDGCSCSQLDADGDGTSDCFDECPQDPNKTVAGFCGCDLPDDDSDVDGVPDCDDRCPDTERDTEVDGRGCPAGPATQSAPDDGDPCASSLSGEEADADNCPFAASMDEPAASLSRPACGACGAFGMIGWAFPLLGWIGLRVGTARQRIAGRL